jgi:hypothetical protein
LRSASAARTGYVESASPAGLPVDYIVRQFADRGSGASRVYFGNASTAHFLTALKVAKVGT